MEQRLKASSAAAVGSEMGWQYLPGILGLVRVIQKL